MIKGKCIIPLALALFVGLSAYLRIVIPYHHVFTEHWIKFTSIDAYWQMTYIDYMAPNFPNYAIGVYRPNFFHWLVSGTIYCIGLGNPSQHLVDTIGAYFPAILGILTIIPVYSIGKILFGNCAGLVSAGLIAVLPGEWLSRSSLGFTDYHIAEVFSSTTAMLFLILCFKSVGKRRLIYGASFCLFMFMYWKVWSGAIIFLLIMGIYLGTLLVYACGTKGLGAGLGAGTALAVLLHLYYRQIVARLPAQMVIEGTMEMMPFSIFGAWVNFGIVALIAPIALFLLCFDAIRGNKSNLLLIIWSLVTLGLMLNFTRFAYYFAVNAALLSGYFMVYIWNWLSRKDRAGAIATIVILCSTMWITIAQQATIPRTHYVPSDAWCNTLTWVSENTPEDSIILSWWDYGYWIKRMGKRKAFVTPAQDPIPVMSTAYMLLAVDSSAFAELIDADYIILDKATITDKLYGITLWAGKSLDSYGIGTENYNNSFMVRLWREGEVTRYKLVYNCADVKVFKRYD